MMRACDEIACEPVFPKSLRGNCFDETWRCIIFSHSRAEARKRREKFAGGKNVPSFRLSFLSKSLRAPRFPIWLGKGNAAMRARETLAIFKTIHHSFSSEHAYLVIRALNLKAALQGISLFEWRAPPLFFLHIYTLALPCVYAHHPSARNDTAWTKKHRVQKTDDNWNKKSCYCVDDWAGLFSHLLISFTCSVLTKVWSKFQTIWKFKIRDVLY